MMSKLLENSPIAMLVHWAHTQPDETYLRQPDGRQVRELTWGEVLDQVLRIAQALRSLEVSEGDRVAIISKNCAEWFIADFAIQAAGLVSVPIFPTASSETIHYTMDHSEAKVAFVGKLDEMSAVDAGIPEDVITISMPYPTILCAYNWGDLLEQHAPLEKPADCEEKDLFSITYTSGSTGAPKGVELTYGNIRSGALAAKKACKVNSMDRFISYLPLSHLFERVVIEHLSLYAGSTVSFVEILETFAEDLKDASPTIFVSVPRLWVKFYSGILAKVPQRKLDRLLSLPIISGLVRKKIRKQLGLANARICASGSAPMSPALLRWFDRLGIQISEGWGMTETSAASTLNMPYRRDKIGTIGSQLDGNEIKLSDEGEIMIRGKAVFRGYHKNPKATATSFVDGWFRTGDRAEIDADGYYTITGRLKDIFKTAKGKYVAPVPIESLIFENTFVEQVCVLGAGLAQPVALVNLSPETTQGISQQDISQSLEDTRLRINGQLEKHAQLGQIIVSAEAWTIENDFLTPTLKIRRNRIEDTFTSEMTAQDKEAVTFL